jgi:hypothetical protein
VLLAVIAVAVESLYQSGYVTDGPIPLPYRITNLEFIDGGTGADIILATVKSEYEAINITDGYVNGNATTISGTLTIPEGETGTVLLALPSGTLVAGQQYTLELKIRYQEYTDSLFASERGIFYHMYHPKTLGPVEEGVITKLHPWYHGGYSPDADIMICTVQNTGDFAITITGGFINGHARRDTTGDLTIEKGAHQQVTMYFPPASLLDQMLNGISFQVKLVTARDNIIAYAEPEPVMVPEQGGIINLKFVDGGTSNDLIVATVENTGSASMNLTSSLVNGKAAYFLPSVVVIPTGGNEIVTLLLPAGTFVNSVTYQVVLITSHNNALICTSTYSEP